MSRSPAEKELIVANPGPLGLSAFAMNTFVYSMFLAEVLGIKIPQVGLGLALFYGGIIQVLAGMWEMKNGNTLGATIFSSYGGFWISFGFIALPSSGIVDAYKNNTEMLDNAIGIYLVGWTIYTFFILICALRTNLVMISALISLLITYIFLDIGKLAHNPTFDRIGGGFGVLTAFIAWYMAIAQMLVAEPSYFNLPLWPRNSASEKFLQEA